MSRPDAQTSLAGSRVPASTVLPSTRLAPSLVMAHERLLPVPGAFGALFGVSSADSGHVGQISDHPALMRGHTVACTGTAAMSCALTLVGSVTRGGAWAAIVGLPAVGVMAASELGVALERTVFVADPRRVVIDGQAVDAATVVATLIDGLEMVVVAPAVVTAIGAAGMRRLQSRAHTKGALLVVVGEQRAASADLCFTADVAHWEGLGEGHGHLQRRRVRLTLDGRRRPRAVQRDMWLPDATGGVSAVEVDHPTNEDTSRVVVPFRRAG